MKNMRKLSAQESRLMENNLRKYEVQIEDLLFKKKTLEFETSEYVVEHRKSAFENSLKTAKRNLEMIDKDIEMCKTIMESMKKQIKEGVEQK